MKGLLFSSESSSLSGISLGIPLDDACGERERVGVAGFAGSQLAGNWNRGWFVELRRAGSIELRILSVGVGTVC